MDEDEGYHAVGGGGLRPRLRRWSASADAWYLARPGMQATAFLVVAALILVGQLVFRSSPDPVGVFIGLGLAWSGIAAIPPLRTWLGRRRFLESGLRGLVAGALATALLDGLVVGMAVGLAFGVVDFGVRATVGGRGEDGDPGC